MNKRFASFIVAALFSLAPNLRAAREFDGLWKLNLAKSKVAGQTFVIEKQSSGKMYINLQGFEYDFDLSGKEFPTPDGGTIAVTSADPKTWEFTGKMKGKVIGVYRFSVDGDKASMKMIARKEDGSDLESTTNFERVSGGPGHVGKWRSKDASGAPPSLKFATVAENKFTFDCPELKMTCQGAFDGKDHVVNAQGETTKQTFVFERKGAKSFQVTTKIDGKPFMIEVFTLSDDGKTLTDNANFAVANEPVTYVFEKQ